MCLGSDESRQDPFSFHRHRYSPACFHRDPAQALTSLLERIPQQHSPPSTGALRLPVGGTLCSSGTGCLERNSWCAEIISLSFFFLTVLSCIAHARESSSRTHGAFRSYIHGHTRSRRSARSISTASVIPPHTKRPTRLTALNLPPPHDDRLLLELPRRPACS